ncbi:hypothetical protein HF086_007083 [Spodoptera exigua]|uniref:Uncharacterized protein n=1 Tax=Spodoptera exigua TaxID=7107 RepID=A0A922MG88_SPOEX|nr:hypothetical protein HF086_007083 [Spodoptera exigua]
MVLLDCSKLQLGRGRRDDSVAAFRRRLEVFRELSLPMLKTLDQDHRLVIVDGDTDSPDVQTEFTRVLLEEMEKAEALAAMPQPQEQPSRKDPPSMQQFATAVSRMGGGLANGHANGSVPNGNVHNDFFNITKDGIGLQNINQNVLTILTEERFLSYVTYHWIEFRTTYVEGLPPFFRTMFWKNGTKTIKED